MISKLKTLLRLINQKYRETNIVMSKLGKPATQRQLRVGEMIKQALKYDYL